MISFIMIYKENIFHKFQEKMGDGMPKKHRVIFHIDMNCYFASVEIAHRPELKGKPVAIAGNAKER